jgi:transcription factor IIIB 90 kDa subunit
MAATCKECGGRTQWEPEAGSSICTGCGTLEDASQQVLDSHLEISQHDSMRERPFLNVRPSNTLKSFRNVGWDLAGQGKEARDLRNLVRLRIPCTHARGATSNSIDWLAQTAMHEYITTIGRRLGFVGQTQRAVNIFTTLMERGKFRWGRKARLMAGAALAISLREAKRSDSLRDIGVRLTAPRLRSARSTFSTGRSHSCSSTSPPRASRVRSLWL